ncbi:MAG: beta-hydroxyacyl-ACP dehydratase [Planctomycetota bacterium]
MRWLWIDKFTSLEPRTSAVAVKNVTAAEEHLHDLYPGFPVCPHSLIVEGMAQTAGILVGHANDFALKVILAKVGKAEFHRLTVPGDTLTFSAKIDTLNDTGAGITGKVTNQDGHDVADIQLMFSHIDNNMGGRSFPEHNFVFHDDFKDLVRGITERGSVEL